MTIRNRLAIALVVFLAPMVFASTAYAQAGLACAGTSCGLGGQIRGQIGDGLPLPISIAPARTGPFADVTFLTNSTAPGESATYSSGQESRTRLQPAIGKHSRSSRIGRARSFDWPR